MSVWQRRNIKTYIYNIIPCCLIQVFNDIPPYSWYNKGYYTKVEVFSMKCPKCKSENILVQQVQTGSATTETYKAPKKKSCLNWILGGWIIDILYFCFIGWWRRLLFGKKQKVGTSTSRTRMKSKTMATCQSCGHTWKVWHREKARLSHLAFLLGFIYPYREHSFWYIL